MTRRALIFGLLTFVCVCTVISYLSLTTTSYNTYSLWSRDTSRHVQVRDDPHRVPNIPHIIHQAWDSHNIPAELADWIKSWKDYNPLWQYWLWTPDDVRTLLSKRYPEYLPLYNSYHFNIFRSDAMRYFIMDTFGGFYADLDMECFKPLDIWTYDHQCILSHETYEHPFLLFEHPLPNVMTTILASRPGHPFFKEVIKALPESFKRYPADVLNGTGPFFLDRVFRAYNKSGEGVMVSDPSTFPEGPQTISVLPPKVFLPTFDPNKTDSFRKKCQNIKAISKNPDTIKTCNLLQISNFSNDVPEESYSNHYWVHIFLEEKKWKQKKTVPVEDIIPDVKFYRQ